MTKDLRTRLRSALLGALAMLPFAAASLLQASSPAWGGALRYLLAGAIVPLVFIPLAAAKSASKIIFAGFAATFAWVSVAYFPDTLPFTLLPLLVTAALASTRFHRHGVVLLFLGYTTCALLLLVEKGAGLMVPPHSKWGFLSFFGLAALAPPVLLWALRTPKSWTRWRIAAPALLLGAFALFSDLATIRRMSDARYLRRADLNAFAAQIQGQDRIAEMRVWNGKLTRTLNRTIVGDDRDSARPQSDSARLARVLARDGIDPATYADVPRKLQRFHFHSFSVHGPYVRFGRTRDGGLVYARPGAPPLQPGQPLPGTSLTVGARVGQWYYY